MEFSQRQFPYNTALHFLVFLLTTLFIQGSEARPWITQIPTATAALPDFVRAEALLPTPFDVNESLVQLRLNKRAAFADTVCGFIGGIGTVVALCSSHSVCIWDTIHNLVGCSDTEDAYLALYTTCYDSNNKNEGDGSQWGYTCPGNEECFLNTYEPVNGQNFYQWGCGKSTDSNTVLYQAIGATDGTTVNIFVTGIDMTETPTSTPEPTPTSTPEPETTTEEPETSTSEEPEPEPPTTKRPDPTTTPEPEPETSTTEEPPETTSENPEPETTTSEKPETTKTPEPETSTVYITPATPKPKSTSSTSRSDENVTMPNTSAGTATATVTAIAANNGSSTNVGAIAGGAAGGVALLAFLIFLLIFLRKRKKKELKRQRQFGADGMPGIGGSAGAPPVPPPAPVGMTQQQPYGSATPAPVLFYKQDDQSPTHENYNNAVYGPKELDGNEQQRWSELSGDTAITSRTSQAPDAVELPAIVEHTQPPGRVAELR